MITVTRQPRLLVKMPAAPPPRAALSLSKSVTINVQFEKLFSSIRPSGALGVAAQAEWHIMTSDAVGGEVNAWDLCHRLVHGGLGIAGAPAPEFAEPDLEQHWVTGTDAEHAFAAVSGCDHAANPNPNLPTGDGFYWFRDPKHSELEAARTAVGKPTDRVRIAHFDTGYDAAHSTLPSFLRKDLQRNFVDDAFPNDATDRSDGFGNNLGHGTGTLSLLAGGVVEGSPLGGAPFLDVIPVRVANSVVLFRNSAIAKAFDYAYGLYADPKTRVHVITMSMGGLASQAWADAVNALYDLGVFVVTAAGNNFANLPTHNIVYPARFNRVVAACGVMADERPYADLDIDTMAGNYGPDKKMDTAVSGCTPNTPWAKFGCSAIVDHGGKGTSAATPQVAAAAALWIQTNKKKWEKYSKGWMRVEAVRKALFDTATLRSPGLRTWLGHGMVRANDALAVQPAAEKDLIRQQEDVASFPFWRVITGLGFDATSNPRLRMIELESLQLTQRSHELEQLLPDPANPGDLTPAQRQGILAALAAAPGASQTLREEVAKHLPSANVPIGPAGPLDSLAAKRLDAAMNPKIAAPGKRRLRVYAFDPILGTHLETLGLNETTLEIRWEKDLAPGPVGDYIEVVDLDPASGCCYAPVDLNHYGVLAQDGLSPSESNPHFHQQMVYAVAMKTIEHFERALGRVALFASRKFKVGNKWEEHFTRRLRIYPHAIREANSFYSPDKKSLLFGYFPASQTDPGDNLPGGTVFCALSHDIVAHETTHSLLDGLHPRFGEATNQDMLAFHEAFADIVALFQHFTVPEALRDQIAKTQGDLARQNILGELAQQFGQATGTYGALRSAIGTTDPKTKEWKPAVPTRDDYQNASEPHELGAVLVAAVFDAFLEIYRMRSADLIRLATGGTGVLPPGAIPNDLVNRLAQEASKTASHVLNICIRALDYCPPVDLTFGDYVRALITADYDLVPDDRLSYRVAFIQAFRKRGIYPQHVRNLSSESLSWEKPETNLQMKSIRSIMSLSWDLHCDRQQAFVTSKRNARRMHDWFKNSPDVTNAETEGLGFYRGEGQPLSIEGVGGMLTKFEVHSVRPVRRVGPDGQQRSDVVIEITQSWIPDDHSASYRGGCTLIVDQETLDIRYCIRKRVAHPGRVADQQKFLADEGDGTLRASYFSGAQGGREPFAMLHRGM